MEPMDIDRLQKLAGLELDDHEQTDLVGDLEALQGSIDRLESVDVSGTEPAFRPVDPKEAKRSDAADDPLSDDAAFSNAPAREDDHFSIPSTTPSDDDDR